MYCTVHRLVCLCVLPTYVYLPPSLHPPSVTHCMYVLLIPVLRVCSMYHSSPVLDYSHPSFTVPLSSQPSPLPFSPPSPFYLLSPPSPFYLLSPPSPFCLLSPPFPLHTSLSIRSPVSQQRTRGHYPEDSSVPHRGRGWLEEATQGHSPSEGGPVSLPRSIRTAEVQFVQAGSVGGGGGGDSSRVECYCNGHFPMSVHTYTCTHVHNTFHSSIPFTQSTVYLRGHFAVRLCKRQVGQSGAITTCTIRM